MKDFASIKMHGKTVKKAHLYWNDHLMLFWVDMKCCVILFPFRILIFH